VNILRPYIPLILTINILFALLYNQYAWSEEIKTYNKQEQEIFLKIARDTLKLYLNKKMIILLKDYPLTPNMQKKSGVFVTLREKATGNLRGCIGYIIGKKPLPEAVIDCTIQASTRDNRFQPMGKDEVQKVYIEISVLTPPQKINDIDDITVGKHGLIIAKGFHTGILLPQVPVEWGWDRDEFLKAICRKAGLPDKSWEVGAELYTFTAQVFGEKFKPN
jgi:AmmeMemoRadiSam system protein A